MFVSPAHSISCITCMQQGGEGGNNKGHESPGKIRLDGFVSAKPYGGTGGGPWDDGIYHGVREITVASSSCIESIRVAYDKDDKLVIADKHGGDGGSVHPQIKLEYPDEFLVRVSGNYFKEPRLVCNGRNPVVIRSLKFESNRRTFGPFGIEEGTPFSFTVEDGGQIVGMKGRSGLCLDAIGFHIAHAPKRKLFHRVKGTLYGGIGGGPWDDGMYHGVREITVASDLCIESIRLAYDKDGELVNGDKHGGDTGSVNPRVSFNKVKLDYPDEFLVSVSGNYFEAPWIVSNGRHPVVIRSLKFESNRRTFGPFGIEVGTPFSFTVEDGGQIVGMKGRSGWYLDAIGFHIAHAPERKMHRTCSTQEGRCDCKGGVWGRDEIQKFWQSKACPKHVRIFR